LFVCQKLSEAENSKNIDINLFKFLNKRVFFFSFKKSNMNSEMKIINKKLYNPNPDQIYQEIGYSLFHNPLSSINSNPQEKQTKEIIK
tara:strand:- start:335 stop:598 length:264 start_codon:yes stop_codon:yes gene_type:complete